MVLDDQTMPGECHTKWGMWNVTLQECMTVIRKRASWLSYYKVPHGCHSKMSLMAVILKGTYGSYYKAHNECETWAWLCDLIQAPTGIQYSNLGHPHERWTTNQLSYPSSLDARSQALDINLQLVYTRNYIKWQHKRYRNDWVVHEARYHPWDCSHCDLYDTARIRTHGASQTTQSTFCFLSVLKCARECMIAEVIDRL